MLSPREYTHGSAAGKVRSAKPAGQRKMKMKGSGLSLLILSSLKVPF